MPDDAYQAPTPPKVSVILVVCNQATELRRAIAALEKSNSRDQFEILVVDRASADDTPTLDEEFPSLTMLRLPFDFGATKAMNIATRTAKGDFLFFLPPNIEVEPATVVSLAERMESDPGAAAACPLLVDSAGLPVPQVQAFPDSAFFANAVEQPVDGGVPDISRESVDIALPGNGAILVRRRFVAGMNYFDERLGHYWADADLALQIHRALKKIRIYTPIIAKWHPPASAEPNDTAHQADRALGAAVLLGKYNGFFAGFAFRTGTTLKALLRFKFGLLSALLSGQKLDGSGAG